MVKIVKGKDTAVVPRGAFEAIFKKQGWKIAGEEKPEKSAVAQQVNAEKASEPEVEQTGGEDEDAGEDGENQHEEPESPDGDSGEMSDEELSLIPLSEMDKDQLKRYAKINGIDLTGCKKTGEVRERIKQKMTE